MPLLHTDYSGFFPFYVFDDSEFESGGFPRNVRAALASMTKAYWLAKAVDWSIDLSWATSDGLSGTVSGSGTVDLSGTIPQQRTVPLVGLGQYPTNLAGSESLDWTSTYLGSTSSGSDGEFSLCWFTNFGVGSIPAFVTKDDVGDFLSCLIYDITGVGGPEFSAWSSPEMMTPFSPISLIIDGVTYSVPLFSGAGVSGSGSLTVDFNSFWTP